MTCNLFTLYSMERVIGIVPWEHPWLQPHKRTADNYLAEGALFERWQSCPEMALVTYVQLQRRYGWAAFEAVFRRYAETQCQPATQLGKIHAFVRLFSQQVGADLRPYFAHWGWPVHDQPGLGAASAGDGRDLDTLPPARLSRSGELRAGPRVTSV